MGNRKGIRKGNLNRRGNRKGNRRGNRKGNGNRRGNRRGNRKGNRNRRGIRKDIGNRNSNISRTERRRKSRFLSFFEVNDNFGRNRLHEHVFQ